MRFGRRRYLYAGLAGLGLLGLWLWLGRISLLQSFNSAPKLYNETNVLWLDSAAEVKQEFTATYPGLAGVDILVTGPKAKETTLTLLLRADCQTSADLRRSTVISAGRDGDGRLIYSFAFAPIDASTNHKFCFKLESNLSGEMSRGVGVLVNYANVYSAGRLFYTPPPKPLSAPAAESAEVADLPHRLFLPVLHKSQPPYEQADVGFNLRYNGPAMPALAVFWSRLLAHKPYLFGSSGFYLVLLLSYGVGVILLLRAAFGQAEKKDLPG